MSVLSAKRSADIPYLLRPLYPSPYTVPVCKTYIFVKIRIQSKVPVLNLGMEVLPQIVRNGSVLKKRRYRISITI